MKERNEVHQEPNKLISTEMLTDIILIQQAGLFSLQAQIDSLEAQIDLGREVQSINLFPKVDELLSEFEETHNTEYYKVVSAVLNMKELIKYLYEPETNVNTKE